MFLIDVQNKKAVSLEKQSFAELKLSERYDLQEWIAGNPSILGEDLLIIQKEFDGFLNTNERLDLLALDKDRKLVVIENKLDDSGKDVVWQSLKYASYCAALKTDEICKIYQDYLDLGVGGAAPERIAEFYGEQDYGDIRLNPAGGDQRIILAAASFRKEVTSTVLWLREHGVDITCIKVTPYKDDARLYLDVEQILPIQDIGDYQIRLAEKKQEDAFSSKEEARRYRFWKKALPILREATGLFDNVSPTKDNWLAARVGHKGISFNVAIRIDSARTEIYIDLGDKGRNDAVYSELVARKAEAERAFGEGLGDLDWQEHPDKRMRKICVHYRHYGSADEKHWDEVIGFFADSLLRFMGAFEQLLSDAIAKS
ncbi:MAG: DUF4268 domain-containing protein [Coriobacteriia bacterium]|nr:DUF4268 domain-containing protein [Coriobacteriia bacterium]